MSILVHTLKACILETILRFPQAHTLSGHTIDTHPYIVCDVGVVFTDIQKSLTSLFTGVSVFVFQIFSLMCSHHYFPLM